MHMALQVCARAWLARKADVGFVGLRLKRKRRSTDPLKLTAGRVSPGKT